MKADINAMRVLVGGFAVWFYALAAARAFVIDGSMLMLIACCVFGVVTDVSVLMLIDR